MESKESTVFDFSREPVHVMGLLELTLDLGDDEVIGHTFDVLESTESTCILG